MSKAVNITWHRKDRRLLPELHEQIFESAETYGLQEFEILAKLAFTHPAGARKGLETLAAMPKGIGDNHFPLPPSVMPAIRLFVPTKLPTPQEMTTGRNIWSKRDAERNRRLSRVRVSNPDCRPVESFAETQPQFQPALRIVDHLRRRLAHLNLSAHFL
jgi:hypothetical protein